MSAGSPDNPVAAGGVRSRRNEALAGDMSGHGRIRVENHKTWAVGYKRRPAFSIGCARRNIQAMEIPVYDLLLEINQRPEPFSEYTARELWTDPYISERMLSYHLNETIDMASRNHAFLDRSAEWIVSHFGLNGESRVADFGCGPGLLAQRLARSGPKVTGIDFSANSLRHAREKAAEEHLDIEFVEADYLEYETDLRFDLILMIMCDFCVLSPDQRFRLLRKYHALLADGGTILLDVYSSRMFNEREEGATYGLNLLDGFWAPGEYFGFHNIFKYDNERIVLEKYTIVERSRIRRIFNWYKCFDPSDIESEFKECGLKVVEFRGDVAGSAYDPESNEFAVVAGSSGV
jgi:cyclopropane fatty-acyl-phospholipid synthase-like methyltransferase